MQKETSNADIKIITPTKENLKIINRYVENNQIIWLVQSGSAVEFLFTGTYLEAKIISDGSYKNSEDFIPRFAVFVNNIQTEDIFMKEAEKNIIILNTQEEKTSTIKIIKLTEDQHGSIGLESLKIKSNADAPLKPTEQKKLKIEFIGDSITCGYGIEAKTPEGNFSTKFENFTKTYAYKLSDKLNADYYTCCNSGFGVVSGCILNPNGEKFVEKILPVCYEFVGRYNGFDKYKWNFSENKVDIILVNIGTNDFTYILYDYENRLNEFKKGYKEFLFRIRRNNPNAFILCTYGMMDGYDLAKLLVAKKDDFNTPVEPKNQGKELYYHIEEAIKEFKSENNDEKISCFLSNCIPEEDGFGTKKHPNEITNDKNCEFVLGKIKEFCKEILV